MPDTGLAARPPEVLMSRLFRRILFEFGQGRARTNARTESDELQRAFVAIDALGARLAARSAAFKRAA
jgi:hypothetical protein